MTVSRDDEPIPRERSGGGAPVVVETRGLTKTYGPVAALKALDLSVRKNSIFGFLGPNGAGKSTAMKLLLGLAQASRSARGSATSPRTRASTTT
jgi:ABC-type multidrug transport system ATPase subunit